MHAPSIVQQAVAYTTPFYQEPHRAYHNLKHIEFMLDALKTRHVLTLTLELAVWGHDLIYNPHAKDNEEQSARKFDEWLKQQKADPALRQDIQRLILATKHTVLPQQRDEQLLIDADLAVLGASTDQFEAYDRAIRQEYKYVPSFLYQKGRVKILQSFLERPRIFSTPEFESLEKQARINLQKKIQELK